VRCDDRCAVDEQHLWREVEHLSNGNRHAQLPVPQIDPIQVRRVQPARVRPEHVEEVRLCLDDARRALTERVKRNRVDDHARSRTRQVPGLMLRLLGDEDRAVAANGEILDERAGGQLRNRL
jgi:hypothetical protein